MEYLVQGDVGTQIQATITRSHDGSAVDISSSTVTMKFRKKGTTTVLSTLSNVSTGSDLTNGIAIFSFTSGTLDVDSGYYEGEISIAESGSIETDYEIIEFFVREDF